jgi:hypothetical protein
MDDRPPPPPDASGPAPPPPPPPGVPEVSRKERPLPLRQMGIGELIDAAIKLYRAEWKVLMGIVAAVLVPLTFLQAFLTRGFPSPFAPEATFVAPQSAQRTIVVSSIIGVIQLLLVQPFLTAAVARAAANIYVGDPVEMGPISRFAVSRIHSILWIAILTFLIIAAIFVVPAVLIALAAVGGAEGPGIAVVLVLLFVLAFGAVVYTAVRLAFAAPALVIEGKKGSKALGRSWRLAKGNFWRLFGALILAYIMTSLIASVLSIPGAIVAGILGAQGWAVAALGNSLAAVVTTPFRTLITVLLYFDLRIRKEAFDIEVMAQELPPGR